MNEEIKAKAKMSKIPLWKVAKELGIADYVLSKRMREELPEEEQKKIFAIIDNLAAVR